MKISIVIYGWGLTDLGLRECLTLSVIAENAPVKAEEVSTICGVVIGTVTNSAHELKKRKLIYRTPDGYKLTENGQNLHSAWLTGKTTLPRQLNR